MPSFRSLRTTGRPSSSRSCCLIPRPPSRPPKPRTRDSFVCPWQITQSSHPRLGGPAERFLMPSQIIFRARDHLAVRRDAIRHRTNLLVGRIQLRRDSARGIRNGPDGVSRLVGSSADDTNRLPVSRNAISHGPGKLTISIQSTVPSADVQRTRGSGTRFSHCPTTTPPLPDAAIAIEIPAPPFRPPASNETLPGRSPMTISNDNLSIGPNPGRHAVHYVAGRSPSPMKPCRSVCFPVAARLLSSRR